MKLLTFLYLFLIVFLFGCLGSQQTATQPTETGTSSTDGDASSTLAMIELSSPKTTYSAQDPIPVELTTTNGKYDLLVPISSVTMQRAFRQLTVTDSNGQVVMIKKPIPLSNTMKTLYKAGKSIRCVQGLDMRAGTAHTSQLENLQTHYRLEPGSYTVQVKLELEVYREFMQDQHREIIELQREIFSIQNSKNPQFTPEVKKEAIGYTQDQIDLIKEKYIDKLQNIYLPLNARRGKALLESNTISLTIQ